AVEDLALVLDDDAAVVALLELLEDLDLRGHLVLAAEDAEVLEHGRSQVLADLPRPLALADVEQRLELALGVRLEALGHLDRRVRQRPLGGSAARAPAEGDRLH